ncbi:ABC transporter permease [Gordonia liuliyuniae]|uniref:ABC transporter permease n=1 Tax=Gordonia liuliyuniae TaxID=2911517 RepID=A0ABS9INW6_9ACTN|nr:ABC transporter permease [Gordonia liuliyuniae]MCF8587248.1 ABC transporter permease [Gordonia liuliyuniae]
MSAPEPASAWTSVRLIAAREIVTRVKTRSFIVTNIIMLLVAIVGCIVASQFVDGDDTKSETVAVQGVDASTTAAIKATGERLGVSLSFSESPDARAAAADGSVTAAIVAAPGGGYTVYSEDDLDTDIEAAIKSGVSAAAVDGALAKAGVDPATLQRGAAVTVERTKQVAEAQGERLALSYVGSVLMFMMIFGGGMAVAVGVVEEKVSRIVEILLATVKPGHLLWGKILGIGVVQMASTLLFAAAALITAQVTGLLTVPDVAATMLGVSVIWLLLGFAFFSALYAATGAMVSRQEEINSASWPLMILAMGALYAGIFGIGAPDSTAIRILAWIPPFSSTVVPMRVATGYATWMEVLGSCIVMAVVTGIAVWIAGRIYRRSVLLTGSRVPWKTALGK